MSTEKPPRLRAYLLNFKRKRFIGPVDADQARGFTADIIVYERRPDGEYDDADLEVFEECQAHMPAPYISVLQKAF